MVQSRRDPEQRPSPEALLETARREDSRAGRWWWESRDTKECGLHITTITPIPASAEAGAAH